MGILPGYRGYQQKEKIRESDRLVREEVARHLTISLRYLEEIFTELVSRGESIAFFDKVKLRTDSLRERIKHGEYGYAGLFDPVKIKEEELTALTEFDFSLIEETRKIEGGAQRIMAEIRTDVDTEIVKKSISDFNSLLSDLEVTMSERKNHMLRLNG
jgi:hypothetical protein